MKTQGVRKRLSVGSLSVSLGLAVALLSVPAPAFSESDSGSKNCTGNGRIVPTVTYQVYHGVSVVVKQAGPAGGPSWGASIPGAILTMPVHRVTDAWVSPYAEGTWSASTNGDLRALAQCSQRSAPTGTAVATRSLGNKTCGSGVRVDVDGFGDMWVSWKGNSTSTTRSRVLFSPGTNPDLMKLNRIYTRDHEIFDIRIHVYDNNNINADNYIQGADAGCA